MIFGIGNIERVAIKRQTLRSEERRAIKGAIVGAMWAGADGFEQRAAETGNDDPVVIGIRDEDSIAFRISQNLAGKSQRQVADLRPFQNQPERLFVEFAALRNSAI